MDFHGHQEFHSSGWSSNASDSFSFSSGPNENECFAASPELPFNQSDNVSANKAVTEKQCEQGSGNQQYSTSTSKMPHNQSDLQALRNGMIRRFIERFTTSSLESEGGESSTDIVGGQEATATLNPATLPGNNQVDCERYSHKLPGRDPVATRQPNGSKGVIQIRTTRAPAERIRNEVFALSPRPEQVTRDMKSGLRSAPILHFQGRNEFPFPVMPAASVKQQQDNRGPSVANNATTSTDERDRSQVGQLRELLSRSYSSSSTSQTGVRNLLNDGMMSISAVHHAFSRRYRVTSELGCGGFGLVVSAQVIEEFSEKHLSRGEEVAVKFILKNRVDDNSWIEDRDLGFVPMEVHVLKAIKHENVIRFLDFYEDEVFVYLVMELHGTGWTNVSAAQSQFNHLRVNISGSQLPSVKRDDKFCYAETAAANKSNSLSINSGPSLQRAQSFPTTLERRPSMDLFECIERHEGTITEEQARFVFVQVLRAVSYMHNRGLVHRDIKDENIVVDEDFNVKMIDFGSATVDLDPSEYHNRFFGTLQYAPPEILRGERYRARPADVWCCGVLLYALLFGDTPFTSSDQAISRPFCSPPIRILRRLRDPRSVLALLNWMLQKSPRRRPSVQEILYHPWVNGGEHQL